MGWLFGRKKKVPKVPFPEGHSLEPGTLKFPDGSGDKIIQPDNVKKAAGLVENNIPLENPEPLMPREELPSVKEMVAPQTMQERTIIENEPLFVKIDVYQRILGEITSLHEYVSELGVSNRSLENSEYNEEANFEKLRRSMKSLHDKLLQADNVLFKT
jgi:hypothetical protein